MMDISNIQYIHSYNNKVEIESKKGETRSDSDGKLYTFDQFLDYYVDRANPPNAPLAFRKWLSGKK